MKNAPQSKPFTIVEPTRVPIVEAYPEELQQVHPTKTRLKFSTNQKFSGYTKKKENGQKWKLGK